MLVLFAPPFTFICATGIRLFCRVIVNRLRARIPAARRTWTVLCATPVASGAIFLNHLVDAHARGYHRVDVLLGIYVEIQDNAAVLPLGPSDRVLHVVALADRAPGQTVGGRELLVVGTRYWGLRVAAVVGELLPPTHHAQGAVVPAGHLFIEGGVPG